MDRAGVFNVVKNTLNDIANIDPDTISESSKFSDLNIDSLDLLEISISLEEEFEFEIDQDLDIHNMDIKSFVDYIVDCTVH